MRRAPVLSCLLWSVTVAGCADNNAARHLDAGLAATDITSTEMSVEGDCGTQPAAQTLSFMNSGTAQLDWTASISGEGFSIVDGARGSAAPGTTASITISPDVVPPSATTGSTISATLLVQTNVRAEPFEVPLAVRVHGGALEVVTEEVSFGQVQVSVPTAATPLTIRNKGDREISVALAAPSTTEFKASWQGSPSAATVAPGEFLPGASTRFTPANQGERTASMDIVTTGPLCAGDAPKVALKGEGTFAQVGVTPGTAAFGTTPCGSTATAKSITVTNNYNIPITYTAQLLTGAYTIANPTGTIPANGFVDVTINASAVPRAAASLATNALDGSVRISTNAPGHTPATVVLDQAASGAVLSLSPAAGSTVAFGNVVAGTPQSRSWTVTNSGNRAAAISVQATGPGFSATTPASGSIAANNQPHTASITQTVTQRGALSGSLAVSTTTNLCQTGSVGGHTLTATGQAPVATVGAAPQMAVTCGGGVSSNVSFTVGNSGDVPLVLSSPSVPAGFQAVTTFPVTIAAGQSATINVRATAAVIGTDRGGTTRTGVLSFTTNEIGAPIRSVNLAAAINGANVDFEFPLGTRVTSMQFTAAQACPPQRSLRIRNSGNQPVTFFATGQQTTHFHFTSPSPSSYLDPGAFTSAGIRPFITDQGCQLTTPERLPFVAQGNICTAQPSAIDLTFQISGQATCFCS